MSVLQEGEEEEEEEDDEEEEEVSFIGCCETTATSARLGAI